MRAANSPASSKGDAGRILDKIHRFCAYQERCNRDVEEKLRSWHVAPKRIRTILIQLTQDGFLNEERFAKVFVRGKFNQKKWGKVRLHYELVSRKIPVFIIEEALSEIDEATYLKTLGSLLIKKYNATNKQKTLNLKEKLFNFAYGKGFEQELILQTIKELNIGSW
jgi:regulatory protein